MYYAIARFKSFFRWLVYRYGSPAYGAYSAASDVPGYDGWYTWRGRVVAFRRDDGTPQFVW